MKEAVSLSRRAVVSAGAAAGALVALKALEMASPPALESAHAAANIDMAEGADRTAQYGFVVRVDHCRNCGECVAACRRRSQTPEGDPSRRVIRSFVSAQGRTVTISTSCMHCGKPACMEVCPAGAIFKGDGGIVRVDQERCIGCKYCYQACPYGVPHYNDKSMDKCDYCIGAGVVLGERTYCSRACHVDALISGKVDDLLAKYPDAVQVKGPTEAACYLSTSRV